MKSGPNSLLELLAQDAQARFVVPFWRRRYVWGTTGRDGREVERLWENLRAKCHGGTKHFCGVLLLHKLPGTEVPTWDVVDGQQRLATLFLLLLALRDVCEKRGVDCSDLNHLLTGNTPDECRLVLRDGENNDRGVMDALVRRSIGSLDQKTRDESRLCQAYRYLVAQVEREIPSGSQEFLVSILQGVDLRIQVVDSTEDVRRSFETLDAQSKRDEPPAGTPPKRVIKQPGPKISDPRPAAKKLQYAFLKKPLALLGLGVAVLLCFCAAFVWWDYTRMKIVNYQQIVTRFGVPEGVAKLSADQVQGRAVSYRVESSRSKVRRVTEINGSGRPVDDPAWHNAATMELAYRNDGSLDSITYLNNSGSQVFREVYSDFPKSASGGRRASIDFKFLSPNSAVTLARDFYLPAVAFNYRANDVSAKSGITGAIVDYTESGDILQLQYHNSSDVTRSNGDGVYTRRFGHRLTGQLAKIANFNSEGKPVPDNNGVTTTVWTFTDSGVLRQVDYLGVDGKPVVSKEGFARAVFKYDDQGNIIEAAYQGVDGQPVLDKRGIAKWAASYDKSGNLIKQSSLGLHDEPVLNRNGYAIETLKYDEHGNVIAAACLDVDAKPMVIPAGYAGQKLKYDERDNIVAVTYLGLDDKPVIGAEGCATKTLKYDEHDRLIETAFLGIDGQLMLGLNGYARMISKYDDRGNKTEIAYFDLAGKPMLSKSGFSRETFEYDDRGNIVAQTCFGLDGQPVLNRDGVARLTAKYDERGNVLETACFGTDNKPVLDNNGLNRATFKFDERDNVIETACFGVDGRPVFDVDGVARAVFKYDDRSNKIEVDNFDENGKPMVSREGFARETFKYDARGNMIETAYFGTSGLPKSCRDGYARETIKYDEHDRVIEGACFGIDGLPIEIGGAHRIVNTYDSTGKISKVTRLNINGQPVP